MSAEDSFLGRLLAVAERQPDAVAIEVEGQPALTYRGLVSAAARVGAAIAARGVGEGDVVALALDKSPSWIVGMLGTWWAGAAWMPLDPAQPVARRRAAVERTDCRTAIVAEGDGDGLTKAIAIEALLGGALVEPFSMHPTAAHELAYVIFTSGSSGRPKGVAVEHRGLVSMLEQQVDAFGLGPGSRSLWMLAPSFDASVSDVGTALLAGATLCLEPPFTLRRTDRLLSLIEARAISYVDMPPAVLATLEPQRAPPCLDTVVIGGEVCAPASVRAWAEVVRLFNVYGPTEATVCTSLMRCTPTWSRPLLGRPLAEVQYRVVASTGDEASDDEAGELWIAGRQLARGYLGDDEMTAQRFVTRDGHRWYRTGDRVIRRGDDYEFVGRLDRQCKVRGQLVAPEEIETALMAHPNVSAAAVVERPLGRRRALVAFVEGGVSPADLRGHARGRLPDWMVPARIERIDRLPRTSAGKVDLDAIGKMACAARSPCGRTLQGPSEALVAGWFREVLGIEAFGADDDFFDLGGDSLAVVELLAAAANDGVALGPETIAVASTVAGLAKCVAHHGVSEERSVDGLLGEVRDLRLALRWPQGTSTRAPWRHVFITGATGFLGRRVLAEVLRSTDAHVTCLVAPRGESAEARLTRACPAAEQPRVVAVAGDIALPRFGLPAERWRGLADAVDVVVHLAARVSLADPYRTLRAANVLGTRTALELAAEGQPKPLHYASTLSVFVSTDRNGGIAREADDLLETKRVYGGYAQSKWVADALVCASDWAAASYRLGLLVGDRDTARLPEAHWLSMFIRGLATLGIAPRKVDPTLAFDATPVDDAARALVELSIRAEPKVYHLAASRPVTIERLLEVMRRAGVPLASVDDDEWSARIRRAGPAAAAVRLGFPKRTFLPGDRHNHRALDLCQATGIRFDCARAHAAGAAIEAVDDDWLARCVRGALKEDS